MVGKQGGHSLASRLDFKRFIRRQHRFVQA
jgi:hypothetical protein